MKAKRILVFFKSSKAREIIPDELFAISCQDEMVEIGEEDCFDLQSSLCGDTN